VPWTESSNAVGGGCTSDAECADFSFCNGVETCNLSTGLCEAGTPVDCEDGIDCTMGICDDTSMGCIQVDLCQDLFFCNGLEVCDPAHPNADGFGCVAGTPPACDDGVECTVDGCNSTLNPPSGACENLTDDFFCDNLDACDGTELCNPNDPIADSFGCTTGTPVDCDDGVACTIDDCDPSTGVCSHTPDDSLCDNSLFCDGAEFCDPTLDCQSGTAPDCDDGVGCTGDSCDEANDTCVNAPNDANCDNGQFCDGAETCDSVNDCQPGTPPNCNDGVSCTEDSCDEANDTCVNAPNDANCDNGQFCDGAETCDAVNDCQLGTSPDCDDGVGCTDDSCDEINDACVNTANDANCDDSVFCNGAETCDLVNDCQPGFDPCPGQVCVEAAQGCTDCVVASDCDDGVFCNGFELCVSVAGGMGCVAGLDPCDDGLNCTLDACDEINGCTNAPDDSRCSDGNVCNGIEICDAAVGCLPGTPLDCDDTIPCTSEECDPVTGCLFTPDHAACDDFIFCNGPEECSTAFGCVPGLPPTCDPATPLCSTLVDRCVECELDSDCGSVIATVGGAYCDPVTFTCVACLENSHCDDGLACNGLETCQANTCISGMPVDCDDSFACTTDTCVEPGGSCLHTPVDSICDNGDVCDGQERCDLSVGCVPGTALNCIDGVSCTDDSCDAQTGCVNTPNDAHCDNSVACDGVETCDATLDCLPGTPMDCDDGIPCTGDSCTETGGGTCVHTPDDAACDDGVFCNGTEACHPLTGCFVSAPPDCTGPTPFCDLISDSCAECLTDAHCNDGLACNGHESCTGGSTAAGPSCAPGAPVDCFDGADCTIDECLEPSGMCRHAPDHAFCNDGDFCNGEETCQPASVVAGSSSGCRAGEPPNCDDRNPCTIDSCSNSACQHVPILGCIPPAARRVSMNTKGSLLIFSKVELKWAADGTLLQDTVLNISNDYPVGLSVQAYFINGDAPIEEIRADTPPFQILRDAEPGWNTADCRFRLTNDQPTFWSAASGGRNCAPFTVLDAQGPGRPDPETNGDTRVLRGYVVMWAVRYNFAAEQWEEIKWNYLAGNGTIVNYEHGAAWEYNAWAFQAHGTIHGEFLLTPGVLEFDSLEYDQPYGELIFDFYSSGSTALSPATGVIVGVDTDLTLHPVSADLRQDNSGPVITKAETSIWNEHESKFSGTVRCVQCWDETLISGWGEPGAIVNHYLRTALGTDKGKARINGVASTACDFLAPHFKPSESAAILGVAAKMLVFTGGPNKTEYAGVNLFGADVESARILYDIEQGPQTLVTDPILGHPIIFEETLRIGVGIEGPVRGRDSDVRTIGEEVSPE